VKSRFTTVEFPVFAGFIVHIEITKDIQKAIKKYPGIASIAGPEDNETDGTTVYDGGQVCFIFLKPSVSIGTIAHEAWHATRYMLKRVGAKLDSEVVAYHLGYITDKSFQFLRGRRG
jgi:hypothetical protein